MFLKPFEMEKKNTLQRTSKPKCPLVGLLSNEHLEGYLLKQLFSSTSGLNDSQMTVASPSCTRCTYFTANAACRQRLVETDWKLFVVLQTHVNVGQVEREILNWTQM